MADLVGQQLGHYRLTRMLGQGGFADVYLGEHIHLNTLAAIKLIQTRLVSNDIEEFRVEARIIAHLKHPHIVPILDFGMDREIPYLVMEYAENGTVRQQYPRGTILPLATIVSSVKQVASELQYAHDRKLIHRDVKPENMLLGVNHELLLSDFGIAVVNQSSRFQSTRDVVGTVAYMAPEQIQGKPQQASDQYALGVIVYEWLTGERPFNGNQMEIFAQHMTVPPPLREKIPSIPRDVEEVVMRTLAKEPQQRFLRIEAFANTLDQASTDTIRQMAVEAMLQGPFGRWPLKTTVLTIGRLPTNQFILDKDDQVSGRHAAIQQTSQGYAITDIGSANGTYVNDERLSPKVATAQRWRYYSYRQYRLYLRGKHYSSYSCNHEGYQ